MTHPGMAAWLVWAGCLLAPGDPPRDVVRPRVPPALVGEYYLGGGFGHRALTILDGGRFQYEESGCLGVYDRYEGSARVVDGHVILRPERFSLPRTGFYALCAGGTLLFNGDKGWELRDLARMFVSCELPTEFIPVRWGVRLYLVPREEGRTFCDDINLGYESRGRLHGFYCRDGARDMTPKGLPKVPREWEFMLLKEPLQGKVVEVISDRMARIDLGAEGGAWKGMTVLTGDRSRGSCRVVSVGPKTCVIERFNDPAARFVAGQGVRTREPRAD